MKKIVALVLCLVLALSLCTVAFGAAPTNKYYYKDFTTAATMADRDTIVWTSAKDTKYTATGALEQAGNVEYVTITVASVASGVAKYFVKTTDYTKADATLDGQYLTEIASADHAKYAYKAAAYSNFGDSCGQVKAVNGLSYYTWTDDDGVVFVGSKGTLAAYDANELNVLLADGTVATVAKVTPNAHTWAPNEADGKGSYKTYKCSKCTLVGTFTTASVPAPTGYVCEAITGGFVTYAKGATGSTSTTVESAKTFDAGIALYAGMALASVAGSAVVIGKKKEF